MNQSYADVPNRIKHTKKQLVEFCTTEDQIDILAQWRTGSYLPLSNIVISKSEGWRVVELVFYS